MSEKIELTPQELKELEDTIAFRTKTTILLKRLEAKVDKINGLYTRISVLGIQVKIQWGFVVAIILGILGLAFKVLIR